MCKNFGVQNQLNHNQGRGDYLQWILKRETALSVACLFAAGFLGLLAGAADMSLVWGGVLAATAAGVYFGYKSFR